MGIALQLAFSDQAFVQTLDSRDLVIAASSVTSNAPAVISEYKLQDKQCNAIQQNLHRCSSHTSESVSAVAKQAKHDELQVCNSKRASNDCYSSFNF